MEKIFNSFSVAAAVAGGFLASAFGGWDKILIALVSLAVLDYLSGVIKAVILHELSSSVGFKGICKKLLIFVCVAAAVAVEMVIDAPIREIVICFYCANEGISLLENLSQFLPVPEKLKAVLMQIRNREEEKFGDTETR